MTAEEAMRISPRSWRRTNGRSTAEEITIFDSTGTALHDLAAASLSRRERERRAPARWSCARRPVY